MGYLSGFKVTLRQMWKPRVTVRYPEQKRPKPVRFHGRHVLNRYEDGMEKCIGCELCAGVCPARCIHVRGRDNPPDAPVSPGERYGFVYEINYLRCIHCDLCVEACPTEAITESKLFEFSFTSRQDAIYTRDELLVSEDGAPRQMPWEDWRAGDDRNTSAWMRATSPSGSASEEGRVHWSGERGYGVRAPEAGQTRALPAGSRLVGRGAALPASDAGVEGDDPGSGAVMTALIGPVLTALQPVLGVPTIDRLVFAVSAVIVLSGAIGVVLSSHPVYAALSLVMTLFGVAVLFVEQDAQFLAAVQVVVYAGAIVVLFLFVIMLLGVDRRESVRAEKLPGQRPLAFLLGLAALGELLALTKLTHWDTGARSVAGPASGGGANTSALARSIFTTYLLPFELTSVLLIIAVIAAVVLARRPGAAIEPPAADEPGEAERPMIPAETGDESTGARRVEAESVRPRSR